jgi:hypothetical protein
MLSSYYWRATDARAVHWHGQLGVGIPLAQGWRNHALAIGVMLMSATGRVSQTRGKTLSRTVNKILAADGAYTRNGAWRARAGIVIDSSADLAQRWTTMNKYFI